MESINEKKRSSLKEIVKMKDFWIEKVNKYENFKCNNCFMEVENKAETVITLSQELSDKIKNISHNNLFAEFVVLFSAYELFLQRYQNNNCLAIMTPAFEIKKTGLENWTFFDVENNDNTKFGELIKNNVNKFKEIFANQFYNIDELISGKKGIINLLSKNIFVFEPCQNINAVKKFIEEGSNKFAFIISLHENTFEVKYCHDKNIGEHEGKKILENFEKILYIMTANLDTAVKSVFLIKNENENKINILNNFDEGVNIPREISNNGNKIFRYIFNNQIESFKCSSAQLNLLLNTTSYKKTKFNNSLKRIIIEDEIFIVNNLKKCLDDNNLEIYCVTKLGEDEKIVLKYNGQKSIGGIGVPIGEWFDDIKNVYGISQFLLAEGNLNKKEKKDSLNEIIGYKKADGTIVVSNECLPYFIFDGEKYLCENIVNKIVDGENFSFASILSDSSNNLEYIYIVSVNKEIDSLKFKEIAMKKIGIDGKIKMVFGTKLPIDLDGCVDYEKIKKSILEKSAFEKENLPKTEKEKIVLNTFKEVLSNDTINLESNFFDYGGDSIKAIQVSGHLKEAGYSVEITDILQLQIINKIIEKVTEVNFIYSQDLFEGEANLLPVQKRFFINKEETYNFFNHSMTFLYKSRIDIDAVKSAFHDIIEHHDALRSIIVKDNNVIKQIINKNIEDAYVFEFENLIDNDDYINIIEKDIDLIQQKLDIFKGRNSYVKVYVTPNGDYLSLTIHHMVVDGVSWRIILEDFMNLYKAYKNHTRSILPMKTTPFFDWINDYNIYSNNIPNWEKEYWNEVFDKENKMTISCADNSWKKHREKLFVLDKEKTSFLINKINAAFHAEINTVLLAGIGMARQRYDNSKQTIIAVEGHGREPFASNKDVSRTVGWFTSYYAFTFKNNLDVMKQILDVKNAIKEIPFKGINYGKLKFVDGDFQKFSYVKSQILFNYLGEVDNFINEEFKLADNLKSIKTVHDDYDTGYLFAINSIVLKKQLQFSVDYNEDIYTSEEVDRFMNLYLDVLAEIIEVGQKRTERNLSDFDMVDLSEDEIEKIDKKFGLKKIEDIIPLSAMQQGMYYYWKISSDKDLYSEQYMYSLTGTIDFYLFQKSINEIVKNNQALRTVFFESDTSDCYQIVLSESNINCDYYNLQKDDLQNGKIEHIRKKDCDKGFDLNNGPMIRISVLDTENDRFYILICFHHIIMDGWSVPIILQQIIDTYIRLKNGESNTNSKNTIQFKDYIKWLQNKSMLESKYFWKEYLNDADTITLLPYQKRLNNDTYMVQKYSKKLSKNFEERLNALAVKCGVTLYQLIQSVWAILLGKYTRNKTIVFGTVVSGRPIELLKAEEIVGLCINTIPVVRNILDDEYFDLFVKDSNINELSKYSFLQLAEIQNLSQLKNDLISHILIFENYPLDDNLKNGAYVKKAGFSFENVDEFWKTNYDFNLMIVPGNGIDLSVVYNENKFLLNSIEKIISQFINVLDFILDNSHSKIKDISLITEDEKRYLIDHAYNVKFDLKNAEPIYKIIENSVKKYGDDPAVIFGEKKYTYREIDEKANKYAYYLKKNGINKNEVVGVMINRSQMMISVLLGILKCGCAYLPLDKSNPTERLNYMINDSKIRFLFIDDEYNESIDYSGISLNVNEIWENKEITGCIQETSSNIHDLMYMIYTSGSTGKPKAVCIENRSVYNFMISMKNELPYEDVVMLCVTTMAFDIFALEVYLPLMNGYQVVISDEAAQINPDLLADVIEKNSVNVIQMTPSRMRMFLSSKKSKNALSKIKMIILGGEPLTEDIVSEIKKYSSAKIFNVYGPTETTIWSSIFEVKKTNDISIGKPIGNNSFYILDDNNELVPDGVPGELVIGGDGLARGYYNNEKITKEKFIDNIFENNGRMYKTGDIVVRKNDGNITYIERKDFQLKMHGFRIELGEIENTLIKEMGWKNAVVIPVVMNAEKVLVAYYVNDETSEYEEVINTVSKTLPYYMLPAYIVQVDKIPTNTNGKVDRNELKKISITPKIKKAQSLPSTEIEKNVYNIWKENLGISEFDVNDNFFHIGGHSLIAIRICKKLNDIGYSVGIYDLYKMPTVKLISEFIVKLIGKSDNNIEIDNENLLNNLSRKYGECYWDTYKYGSELYKILKINADKEKIIDVKKELRNDLVAANLPDYIIKDDDYFYEELNDDFINLILNDIKKNLKDFSKEMSEKNIELTYNISSTQKFRMEDPQNIISYFDVNISYEKINKVICDIINEQSLMRSFIKKKNDQYVWEQHSKIDKISIPFIDLSDKSLEICELEIKKIAENMFNYQFDDKFDVLYCFLYIKINEKKSKLLVISNHIIFDGFSSQILMNNVRNKLIGIDKGGDEKEYSEYVKLLNKNQANLNYEHVKNIIDLDEYYFAVKELKSIIDRYDRSDSVILDYYVDIHGVDGDIYELSYQIFMMYCHKFFDMKKYPVLSVVYGRKYGNDLFFDTIGEFIDYLPYLIDNNLSGKEIVEFIEDKNKLFEKNKINFTTMISDKRFNENNEKILELLKNKLAIVFNYQGIDNTNNNELFEIIDNNTQYKANQFVRFSTKVIDNKLNIYIYMPFKISKEDSEIIKSDTKKLVDNFKKETEK